MKEMNKKQLLDELELMAADIPKRTIEEILDVFTVVVARALLNGDVVPFPDLGQFMVSDRIKRSISGEKLRRGVYEAQSGPLALVRVARFRASKQLKRLLNP
jgi:nucleoid DNA-binding protein